MVEGQDPVGSVQADFFGWVAEPAGAAPPDVALRAQFDQMMRVGLTVEGGESPGATPCEPVLDRDDKGPSLESAQTMGVWPAVLPGVVVACPPTFSEVVPETEAIAVSPRAPLRPLAQSTGSVPPEIPYLYSSSRVPEDDPVRKDDGFVAEEVSDVSSSLPTPTPSGLLPVFAVPRASSDSLSDERPTSLDVSATVLPSSTPRPVPPGSLSFPTTTQVPMAPLQSQCTEDIPLAIVDQTLGPVQTSSQEEPNSDQSVPQVFVTSHPLPTTQVPPPTPAVAPERSPPLTADAIRDLLQQAVSHLQVARDIDGHQTVRFDIRQEVLPGVRVVLQAFNGRVQVDFICSVEASHQALSEIAQREASEMARRCRRDLLLRVQTDDEDPDLDSAWRSRAIEVLGIS